MRVRQNPHLYQINALAFINRLSAKYNEQLSLASIPNAEWNSLAQLGFDLIWMMGVWTRSSKARSITLGSAGLRKEFDRLLPGWTEEDAVASPYAVYDYTLDPSLGKDGDLLGLKDKLNRLGIGLILDFVPNHLAMDHPWTMERPSLFVEGSAADVAEHPQWYFRTSDGHTLAHGRDPYFDAWKDTVQMNFFSGEAREALVSELSRVVESCDGVRADMAMLALNGVFEWAWGSVAGKEKKPEAEFWDVAISSVRKTNPDFIFMAEVYWGLDQTLREMGFRFTYDKALYDHLRWDPAYEVFEHVRSESASMSGEVHFLENHDEPRAAALFGRERSMAAAAVLGTIPGLRFYQDGQLEGKRIRIPVQLRRDPVEFPDPEIALFYRSLLKFAAADISHAGRWNPIEVVSSWPGNDSHRHIMAWEWSLGTQRAIIAINYSQSRSQAWVKPEHPTSIGRIVMEDILTGTTYVRDSEELSAKGLYVDLGPYRGHIMLTSAF